jgi:hypothetical protein
MLMRFPRLVVRAPVPWCVSFALAALVAVAPPATATAGGDNGVARGSSAPLPDREPFLAHVRENLLRDRKVESQYTYLETRRKLEIDRSGRRVLKEERVHEVYPGTGPRSYYRRLIAVDGQPVPAHELEKQDARRREEMLKAQRERASETPAARARRERKEAHERRKDLEELDDALSMIEVTIAGRKTVDGRSMIVLDLRPKDDPPRPRTRMGRIMRNFTGQALISEADHELVRVELEALDTISVGWGVIARIHRGSRASFERKLVNGEVWLPARAHVQATGRAALVKGIRVDTETVYSDYRKFTADAQITSIGSPRP